MEAEVVLNKLALKASKRKCRHFCTHQSKKNQALINTLVARLTEVQVKPIGNIVITIETEAFVETLSDSFIKLKFKR